MNFQKFTKSEKWNFSSLLRTSTSNKLFLFKRWRSQNSNFDWKSYRFLNRIERDLVFNLNWISILLILRGNIFLWKTLILSLNVTDLFFTKKFQFQFLSFLFFSLNIWIIVWIKLFFNITCYKRQKRQLSLKWYKFKRKK